MHIKKYLTEQAVLEIFAARPRPSAVNATTPTKHERSRTLAQLYGVSTSTIQQIWNRKCWAKVTGPYLEEWELSGTTARSEDESSNSDVESGCATQHSEHSIASDQQSNGHDWVGDAFESEASSLLDDIERLPGYESESPFDVDWEYALSNVGLHSKAQEKSTFDWQREESEARFEWIQDILQAEPFGFPSSFSFRVNSEV
eukprot:2522798-Rhodomonas_salina.1